MRGLLLVALAGGCGPPCLNLADAPIDASRTDEPEAWHDALRETMLDFDRWTGRSTCVSEVVVEPDGLSGRALGDHLGATNRLTRRILLDGRLGVGAAQPVMRHELCHAWDISHGMASTDHPEAFPPSLLPEEWRRTSYRTDAFATAEVFALACERGPISRTVLAAAAEADCPSHLSAGEAWAQEEVYVAFDERWVQVAGVAPVAVERHAVPDIAPNRVWDFAFSGDALWVVTLEHAPPQWVVWRVPLDGGPLDRLAPLPPTDPLPRMDLVAGVDEGLLVATWGQQALSWALTVPLRPWFDGGVPTHAPPAALRVDDATYTFAGDALVVYVPGRRAPALVAALPDDLAGLDRRVLYPHGDGVGFAGRLDGWPVAGHVAPDGALDWSTAPVAGPMATLPDGRRLGSISPAALGLDTWLDGVESAAHAGDVLLVEDPGSGDWALGTCSAGLDAVSASIWRARATHTWGGRAWFFVADLDQLDLISVAAD